MRIRLLGVVTLVIGLLAIGGVASAQACGDVSISPNPGWRGANITISGTGFTPGETIFVNFGGIQVGQTTSNASGAFSIGYTIPGDFPVGTTNVFAQDSPANCEDNPSYTVNASPPTTTTTTTTMATTTTEAPTTTTTEATTTTTEPPTTTTTEAPAESTTTTTEAPAEGDGGSNSLVLVLVGALVGAGLVGGGMYLGRRQT